MPKKRIRNQQQGVALFYSFDDGHCNGGHGRIDGQKHDQPKQL